MASAASRRPSQSAIAEPKCSATWKMNGCAVCSASAAARRPVAGRLDVAERDERRNAPAHRLCLDLRVAQHRSQVPRLGHHLEDLVQRARPARPVGAHEHGGEAGAIAEPPRHRDRARPRLRAAIVIAPEVERAGEPAEQRDPQLGVSRRRARPRPPREARPHLRRRCPGASTSPRSRSRRVRATRRSRARARSPQPSGRRRVTRAPCPPGGSQCRARGRPRPARMRARSGARAPCETSPPPRRTRAPSAQRAPRRGCTRLRARSPRGAPRPRNGARGPREPGRSARPRFRAPHRRAGGARRAAHFRDGRTAPCAPARG